MSWLGFDGSTQPIASLGLGCPLLLSSGLLSERGCLGSLNAFPVDGLERNRTVKAIMTSMPAGSSGSEMF